MNMQNKYITSEITEELKILKEERNKLSTEHKTILDKIQNNNDRFYELRKVCNHMNSDGSSAIKYTGQDPGSGRSESTCKICYTDF